MLEEMGNGRRRDYTRSAVANVLERGPGDEPGGREDGRTCGTVEGWFGTAMNISPAHLFMQYFALAALRRLPLSTGAAIPPGLPRAPR